MNGWLAEQLPASLAGDDLLRRFLGIFEELSDHTRATAGGIEHFIDPAVAPAQLVHWLGHWLGLEVLDSEMPPERQRALVRGAGQVLTWRGTKRGLEGLIELVIGVDATISDAGGVFPGGLSPANPNRVWVSVPDTGWTTEERLVEMVRNEVPADVTVEIRVGGRLVWPAPAGAAGNGQGH
ncbi:MAG: phage tail protein [Acidimicrobiia bacterium]